MSAPPGDRRRSVVARELTGAVGDAVTVLPIVVSAAVLTELSLALLLVWFGLAQVVWGLYYDLPMSVEPMKALAALVVSGALTAEEYLAAGLLAGAVLLAVGATRTLDRVDAYVGEPVVRGIQLGVAAVLLEAGADLAWGDLGSAAAGVAVAGVVVLAGYRRASALAVLAVGGVVAAASTGVSPPSLPPMAVGVSAVGFTRAAGEATVAQLGMTVGNAAVATSLLVGEFYDRDVSADELAATMGVTNLVAVPLGGVPMCHGSGGLAGKHASGARTAGANLALGAAYVAVALCAVSVVRAFPLAMLGVVLAVVAAELGRAGLDTSSYALTVAVAAVGVVANLAVAFVGGVAAWTLLRRYGQLPDCS